MDDIFFTAFAIIGGLFVAFWMLYLLPSMIVFERFFKRKDKKRTFDEVVKDSSYFCPCREKYEEAVAFLNTLGGETLTTESWAGLRNLKLTAKYYQNTGNKTAIVMHGFKAEPEIYMSVWVKYLYEQGFSVLLPDQRAHFGSAGKYITMGVFEANDLCAWAGEILVRQPDEELLCVGMSMGGATVLFASDKLEAYNVKAIIADCPYISPKDQIVRISRQYHIPPFLMVPNALMAANIMTDARFGRKCTDNLAKSKVPVFFIHGENDTTVPCPASKTMLESAPAGSEIYIVPGSEHSVSLAMGGHEAEKRITSFLKNKFN